MGIRDSLREVFAPTPAEAPGELTPLESLREQLKRSDVSAEILQESLSRLELAQEDTGWRRLTQATEREFTRAGLEDISNLSRAMYLSHPLIKRAVNVATYYVFAQGVQFKAKSDTTQKVVIDPLLADDQNQAELFSHQSMVMTMVDQLVEGNIFLALYTDIRGDVEIRSFPLNEIRDIYTKEGDDRMITFYRRVWSETVFDEKKGRTKTVNNEALYPDWRYHPRSKPSKIGKYDVEWDCPIMHQKTGGMKDMQFGVPETYAALDWARAYRKFLEDWHTLIASLAKFSWQVETKGKNIQGMKRKLESTIPDNESGEEENDMTAGQAFVGKPGDKLTPIPKTGASTSAEDGRPARLMVASATNIPDTMLANDPQQGALATAKTLDRPTELYVMSMQNMWKDLFHNIFRYKIDRKIEAGLMKGEQVWNSRKGTMEFIPEKGSDNIDISFPPILEHDMESTVRAICTAATLEGRPSMHTIPKDRLATRLMEVTGIKDIEEALKELATEEESELQEKVKELQDLIKAGSNGPGKNGNGPEPGPEEGDE